MWPHLMHHLEASLKTGSKLKTFLESFSFAVSWRKKSNIKTQDVCVESKLLKRKYLKIRYFLGKFQNRLWANHFDGWFSQAAFK